jgi:hypothetical protein
VSQSNRASFVSLIALCCSLGGCQPLDTNAVIGEPFMGNTEGKAAALETPALELADGRIANDACEAVRLQAYEVLDRTCASCHSGDAPGARQGTPPFDCVLDEERMISMVSASAKDPETKKPARFLAPGDPDHSRIYLRPLHGEMPPPDVIGLPANPRPSVSDLSVLRHWIESCVAPSDVTPHVEDHEETAPDTRDNRD